MISKDFPSWWQQYREAVRCSHLRQELWLLLYGQSDELKKFDRLIDRDKYEHPGELESWYLERAIAIANFNSRLPQNDRLGTR